MKKPTRKASLPKLGLPAPRPDPLRLTARRGKKGDEVVVWLAAKGTRPKRIGSVNQRLAADASRHGQDLVGDLVDTALLAADRRLPPRA